MKPADKKKWVAALRSGKYKQGNSMLRYKGRNDEELYCCLGVACSVFGMRGRLVDGDYYKYGNEDTDLPEKLQARLDLDASGTLPKAVVIEGETYSTLMDINDRSGYTLEQIADITEEQF